MTVSIGAFTFDFADEPDDGDVEFGIVFRTSKFNPIGYAGTITTYLSQPGKRHRVHAFLGETAKQALEAVAAQQVEVTFVHARPPLDAGVRVAIDEFSVTHNPKVPGCPPDEYWYDVWIGMVESGSA